MLDPATRPTSSRSARRALRSCFGFVLFLAAACGPAAPTPVSGLIEGALDLARREASPAPVVAREGSAYRELARTAEVVQGVDFEPGAQEFRCETWTRRGGEFVRDTQRLVASAPIEAITAHAPWELFVALREADGSIVVQQWLVRPPSAGGERGGERGAEAAIVVRATLLRTRDLSGVRVLACDPGGRYLVALDRGGERVLQVPLQRGAVGYASFEAERFPALRAACGVFLGRHVQLGTVWAFEASGEDGVERAIFTDRDEDGVFDEVSNLDGGAWAASGYSGAAWSEHRFVAAR